jgi:two-component system sensor histidine kinase VicK
MQDDHKTHSCILCGKTIEIDNPIRFDHNSDPHYSSYLFDSKECLDMFGRLRAVYGDNFKDFLKDEQYVSDPFWNNVLPTKEEVLECRNEGSEMNTFMKQIVNPEEILELALKLVKEAKNEILLLFSTANSFRRQERSGGYNLLKSIRESNRSIKIRILTPYEDGIKEIIKKLNDELKIETRNIQDYFQMMVTILIVDRRYTLTIELKDDTKTSSFDAVGLAVYSMNKSLTISYVSIFESIWKQAELFAKVKILENQIRVQTNVEKSFLIALARRLKAPLKPLTALAEIIRSKNFDKEKQDEFTETIIKNAQEINDIIDQIMIPENQL